MCLTVSQELAEILVELRPLAKVVELCGQDGLDVLWVGSNDHALACDASLNGVRALGVVVLEEVLVPPVEVVVGHHVGYAIEDEANPWAGMLAPN